MSREVFHHSRANEGKEEIVCLNPQHLNFVFQTRNIVQFDEILK